MSFMAAIRRIGFKWVFAGLVLAASSLPIGAQSAAPSQSGTVQLVSDTCPVVHSGDRVAFTWNPVFDPGSVVEGVKALGLQFDRQEDNGMNLESRYRIRIGGSTKSSLLTVTPLGNDFYRFELTMQILSKFKSGIYRMTAANFVAITEDGYAGERPQTVNSLLDERYCITLQGAR